MHRQQTMGKFTEDFQEEEGAGSSRWKQGLLISQPCATSN